MGQAVVLLFLGYHYSFGPATGSGGIMNSFHIVFGHSYLGLGIGLVFDQISEREHSLDLSIINDIIPKMRNFWAESLGDPEKIPVKDEDFGP
jgi:hypothetical protein